VESTNPTEEENARGKQGKDRRIFLIGLYRKGKINYELNNIVFISF